ncbi:MAG: YecH family protein [Akkermansiaceae bacterium]|nr:YecH family protein [Akkermansiaceae bacterium]
MNEAHVHDIMQMMMETGEVYTRESLKKAIINQFGITTTFCSCSENGMTPAEAVTFLENRGKFIPTEEGFYTDESMKCSH